MDDPVALVVEARLELDERCDPAAVGAAVTAELCGAAEHEGPCRWPHNNAVDAARRPVRFRTLFVSRAGEEEQVRERIETALAREQGWHVVATSARPVAGSERPLAKRLSGTPGFLP